MYIPLANGSVEIVLLEVMLLLYISLPVISVIVIGKFRFEHVVILIKPCAGLGYAENKTSVFSSTPDPSKYTVFNTR